MPNGLSYLYPLCQAISNKNDARSVFIIIMFYKNPVINASNADPDQTPHSAASDLGLHCLQMSLLWDARHK